MQDINENVEFVESVGDLPVARILGFTSKNGRTYSKEAVEQALPMYENKAIYVNHANGPRKYEDHIGVLTNVHLREDGIYGSPKLNPAHPCTSKALWDIKENTPGVGLSHSIKGLCANGHVTKIASVTSVDLVNDPATNRSFTESFEVEVVDEITPLQETVSKLEAELVNITEQYNAVIKEVAELKNQQTKLNNIKESKKPVAILPIYESAKPMDNKTFVKLIKGKK